MPDSRYVEVSGTHMSSVTRPELGEAISVKSDPGLGFKMPLLQNVRYFDSRILTLDDPEPL